ncbi:hypothetical protein TNCV_2091491 [Trichonephila clavipes]|nr:hypothetical protein TNCV_2091491 [Trichonephila clavipes]
MCVAWKCPDGAQHFFCWPILAVSGQSLASKGPVVDRRDLNLVFGHTEATHNKSFLSSPTKYTVEPSWPMLRVLVAALWGKKLAFRTRERRKILRTDRNAGEKEIFGRAVLRFNSASEKESVLLIEDQKT